MSDKRRAGSPETNQIYIGWVLRVLPAGLEIRLADGRRGWIREREIAWDRSARADWRLRYSPGQEVTVTPCSRGVKSRSEWSIRQAQVAFWTQVQERYPLGSVVEGIVTGVMPYGVFVELEPGIAGLVHVSRLPVAAKQQLGEIFWPGDRVYVMVESLAPSDQRIGLTMTGLKRWRDRSGSGKPAVLTAEYAAAGAEKPRQQHVDLLLGKPSKTILVVEDEPEQRSSLVEWLRFTGQQPVAAANLTEAWRVLEGLRPNLLLMDVGLPDVNGIQGIQQIQDCWGALPCVLMTDWGRAEHHAVELEGLRAAGVRLLIKPILPEDLVDILLDPAPESDLLAVPIRSLQTALKPSAPMFGPANLGELSTILVHLRAAVHADKVVVFELDLYARTVSLLAQQGPLAVNTDLLPDLINSPVRDVAEDQQVVMVSRWEEVHSPRFRHLAPLLAFESCLGLPVPVLLQRRYALFVFYAQPTALTELTRVRVATAAAAVQAWLERRQCVRQIADLHRIAVLGQLGRALVHEVSGRLTPLGLMLQQLEAQCDEIEVQPQSAAVEHARQMRVAIQRLIQQQRGLGTMLRSFSRMTRAGEEELVHLEGLVGEAIEILRDAATLAWVEMVVLPVPHLYFTRIQVTYLQQVLVNVIQNAIQQIGQLEPRRRGRVEIGITQAGQENRKMLLVSIEDDGPGIHRRLWERIFEMDYTTRPDGSGLGLYMSRTLIEAQGGHLYVESSHLLWGTRFVMELPSRM
jgi:signal transduction histidine kinase/predicted RNA-binding protein with RPS1 domain